MGLGAVGRAEFDALGPALVYRRLCSASLLLKEPFAVIVGTLGDWQGVEDSVEQLNADDSEKPLERLLPGLAPSQLDPLESDPGAERHEAEV
jgi:hypothetical protein